MTVSVNQDLLVTGPFFTQVGAGNVQIAPTGGVAGTVVKLGNMAAAVGASTFASNGMPTAGFRIPLSSVKTVAGVGVTAAAQANIVGITFTPGTSEFLISEATQNTTKTDVGCFEVVLPLSYIAGQNFTINVNQILNLNSGTNNGSTLAVALYRVPGDGTTSANLVSTSATALTTTASTLPFTVTGTTLSPGERVIVKLTLTVIESANGGAMVANVNRVSFN